MQKRELRVGDLVQINPEKDPVFGGCIVIVTEPKVFGMQGFVQVPGKNDGQAFIRKKFEDFEYVGHAKWMPKTEEAE